MRTSHLSHGAIVARSLLALAAICQAQPLAVAQTDSIATSTDYLLHVWQRDDGLPHNTVSAIAQTRDGYLWIGTHEGLARFDGVRFEHYRPTDTPALESGHVDCLSADVHGFLWIGLERGGVVRWEQGDFAELAPLGAYNVRVNTLAPDGPRTLWAGLSQGRIMRWVDGTWHTFSPRQELPAQGRVYCQMDTDGRTWFASESSLGYFTDDTCVPLVTNQPGSYQVATAREGGMWVVWGRELQRFTADLKVTTIADLAPLGSGGSVQVLYEDSQGAVWLGTKGNGLYRFAHGEFSRIPTSHNFILSICEDVEGNLWAGTWGGGLNRIRPKAIRVFDTRDGLPKSLVLSLGEDTRGSMWIAARNAPPVSLPPGRDAVIVQSEASITPFVSTLYPDRTGGVWLAAERGGFSRWEDGGRQLTSLRGRFIISLFQDSQTNLWIGTLRGGLFLWKEGRAVAVDGGADMQEVTVITEDPEGTLWVGTQKGTVHRRHRNETAFRRFEICAGPPGKKIQAIHADGPGMLWIGTRGAGVFRFKDEGAVPVTRMQGLPDDDIRQILADDFGRLWFGSGSGLFRATRRDLEALVEGREMMVECLSFGASYGLANHEFQEGFRNAMCRSRDGNLWFATTKGAVEVDPTSDTTGQEAPPVHIEQLLVDGRSISLTDDRRIEIPPASGRVEVHYAAVSFTAPENVQFRHKLDPLDTGWIEAGRERSVTYFRVPPGEYRFHVIARGSSGTWNRVGASLVFTVKPTLWQNVWVRTSGFGAALVLVAIIVRFALLRRMHRRMQELEQAQALENERRRIARDMHDDLGASLTRLALMSEPSRHGPQQDPQITAKMNRISRTAKEVAHTLDQIVWTISPGNDTLERLIDYLSQYTLDYLAPTDIRLTQDLPEHCAGYKVNSHIRHEMFLTFKEALNNAVKHSGATLIFLHIRVEGHTLFIILADNGTGFSLKDSQGKGEGLDSLQQRLSDVDGECRIESEPGQGTRITLSLPLIPTGAH